VLSLENEITNIYNHTREIGKILASSSFIGGELVLHINRVSGLSEFYNTFISTCLHPDPEKLTEIKTKTIRKKKNPIFNTNLTVSTLSSKYSPIHNNILKYM